MLSSSSWLHRLPCMAKALACTSRLVMAFQARTNDNRCLASSVQSEQLTVLPN